MNNVFIDFLVAHMGFTVLTSIAIVAAIGIGAFLVVSGIYEKKKGNK